MHEGRKGPLHVFDKERIWHVLAGHVDIAIDDEPFSLHPGDTIVLAAGARRQVSACSDVRLVVCGWGDAVASVPGEAASRGVPPWTGEQSIPTCLHDQPTFGTERTVTAVHPRPNRSRRPSVASSSSDPTLKSQRR
jgi:hypothetical protein